MIFIARNKHIHRSFYVSIGESTKQLRRTLTRGFLYRINFAQCIKLTYLTIEYIFIDIRRNTYGVQFKVKIW